MTKTIKRFIFSLSVLLLVVVTFFTVNAYAITSLSFTEEEKALILRTQNGEPIKMGIIPHSFPLSACPPEVSDFMGINVEMLSLITEKSGLVFDYGRIPLEEKTPYKALVDGDFQLVAGTIKLQNFLNNDELILSDRLCDGSAVCIAQRGTNPKNPTTNKIAVIKGYQAGLEYIQKQFPNYEIEFYDTTEDVVTSVRNRDADLAIISMYVGIYLLQNPLNENLVVLTPYQFVMDSCIMGLNTSENKTAISIINKAISEIGEVEFNNLQMNYIITHPYQLNFQEFLFKYKYIIIASVAVLAIFIFFLLKIASSTKERKLLSRDDLTGAYSEAGFELAASRVIAKSAKQLFITDFDICYFSIYNELHGKEKGDALLKQIAKIVRSYLCEEDIICRSYADNFKVLSVKATIEELIADIQTANILFNKLVDRRMIFNFGVYVITDKDIPISKMLSYASLAKKHVKGNSENFIGVFDNQLHEHHSSEVNMMTSFEKAIETNEFVPYYQPKFDVTTKEIIGAEALVRWIKSDNNIISPVEFIELFEKNGQIRRLDFYMLEKVCIFLKSLINKNMKPVPISVNFSRVHFYSSDFILKTNEIIDKYSIPRNLIEIECTETAMTFDIDIAKDILGKLQAQGISIAMDDFGKAYSSLNALRLLPLDVIKLDRDFLLYTLEEEKVKADKIIRSVVKLSHELSLKIVAEGVETEEQYLFLKSIGCDYIQGYYFSKPLAEIYFIKMLLSENSET